MDDPNNSLLCVVAGAKGQTLSLSFRQFSNHRKTWTLPLVLQSTRKQTETWLQDRVSTAVLSMILALLPDEYRIEYQDFRHQFEHIYAESVMKGAFIEEIAGVRNDCVCFPGLIVSPADDMHYPVPLCSAYRLFSIACRRQVKPCPLFWPGQQWKQLDKSHKSEFQVLAQSALQLAQSETKPSAFDETSVAAKKLSRKKQRRIRIH